jgi:hypothetical protein
MYLLKIDINVFFLKIKYLYLFIFLKYFIFMRKVFDSINQINLKKDEENNLVYIPLKNKVYIFQDKQGVLEKLREITNEDEIMNFHLLKNSEGNLILISKSDKKISLYNKEGEKLKEV